MTGPAAWQPLGSDSSEWHYLSVHRLQVSSCSNGQRGDVPESGIRLNPHPGSGGATAGHLTTRLPFRVASRTMGNADSIGSVRDAVLQPCRRAQADHGERLQPLPGTGRHPRMRVPEALHHLANPW